MRLPWQVRRIDGWLIGSVALCMTLSTVMLFSLNQLTGEASDRFTKQLGFILLSLVVLMVLSQVNYRRVIQYAYIIYISFGAVLLAVLVFGTNVRGTTGWFQFAGISVQPVEFAKIALILVAARFLADHSFEMDRWSMVGRYGLLFVIYCALVLLQPDLGSAVVLAGTATVMGLATAIRPRQLLLLSAVALLLGIISWTVVLQQTQRDRILTFIDPQRDPLRSGYNVTQSVISVGSGQWFGRGLGLGPQSQLQFLPERETDFIFAVIAEELGFVGAGMVVIVFAFIIWRLWRRGRQLKDDTARYMVVGYCALLFGHVLINIGMNIGIMPVTGIPLPFISAGGSSLLAMSIGLGMALNAMSER